MPVITFDKEHLDEGFMFLTRRGEVGCLPNDIFVITDALFDLLQKSHIPFIQVENHRVTQPGERGAEKGTATLGQRIRQARQARGWSQAELAQRAKLTQAYLSYLEADEREPSLSIAARLSQELGIPLDELALAVR
jgi:putative transcriptional regulator